MADRSIRRPRPYPPAELVSAARQCGRIVRAAMREWNRHIAFLNSTIDSQRARIDRLLENREEITRDLAYADINMFEMDLTIISLNERIKRLEQELKGVQPQDVPLPPPTDDENAPESVPMVRQRGYMGHEDRPPGG